MKEFDQKLIFFSDTCSMFLKFLLTFFYQCPFREEEKNEGNLGRSDPDLGFPFSIVFSSESGLDPIFLVGRIRMHIVFF